MTYWCGNREWCRRRKSQLKGSLIRYWEVIRKQ